jgi:hypothetical protein
VGEASPVEHVEGVDLLALVGGDPVAVLSAVVSNDALGLVREEALGDDLTPKRARERVGVSAAYPSERRRKFEKIASK